jgi:autophagy-related protein 9
LLWYAAVFGTITAISRAAVTDELLVLDQEGAMSMVVQHTHYMPKKWRGRENTERVRMEFETLFQVMQMKFMHLYENETSLMMVLIHFNCFMVFMQYTGMMLLEEMASIFLTPFLLLFVVPKVSISSPDRLFI